MLGRVAVDRQAQRGRPCCAILDEPTIVVPSVTAARVAVSRRTVPVRGRSLPMTASAASTARDRAARSLRAVEGGDEQVAVGVALAEQSAMGADVLLGTLTAEEAVDTPCVALPTRPVVPSSTARTANGRSCRPNRSRWALVVCSSRDRCRRSPASGVIAVPILRQELAVIDRLGQEVVGSSLDAAHPVLDGVQRRHQNDRDEPRLGLPLRIRSVAIPSSSGIITSSRTRSGGDAATRSSASRPFVADSVT